MLTWPVRESLLAFESLLRREAVVQYRTELLLWRLAVGPDLINDAHPAPPFPELPEILQ